ncbi:MAG: hypothetical protein GFH27_549287n240 [Chloroflexi bacterium AL-W]|nr:hypothetical protein [Chloroflexi bacterium AL-N1]NOK66514.1 hypothetical protein [Chloroflexi bacterium AL-N10]NOK71902.1 hypothetical protein [Chloroflexi bacterium AL-N5]NOK81159.1 hypothetical protein [Chloroflexi bacterium AL-W]NOK89432.1 hypothetical protein [Chloroflexi bacterium AL-N15]
MTSNYNPWADIPFAVTGQFSRRRVNTEANFALFWFRDDAGRPGLLIEISRLISQDSLQEAKINIRDIAVDVIEVAQESIRALIIKLEDTQNQDVFLKLCLDLIEHVKASEQNQDTFHAICKRLKKWQSLLSGKARNLLSANEVQGLYAELYFLTEILESDRSRESTVIQGWKGPQKTQHDFIWDDMAIEIKSIAGDQRGKVRITSEDQLDTHLERLYLRVYFLSEVHDGGESLNAIVKRIINQLTYRENRELFELKLESARYIDIPDYDLPMFWVKDCRTYLVLDDFPCITRKTLPEGIEAVAYDLVLAGIDRFRISGMEVMEK